VATYVVIHGAGDVGSSWDLVAAELRERGHDVIAPDLPAEDESAGLSEYTDTVVTAVGDRAEVVVVAHSLGGFVAPLVAARRPVDLLVLTAAMVPLPGETGSDWWANSGHAEAIRDRQDDDEIALFLHDVPPDLAAQSLANGRDQASAPLLEPWPLAAWPDVPTRYLLFCDDRFFPAAWTRRMVEERLGITPDQMDGSHGAYLSRPQELAERLEAYRRAVPSKTERERRARWDSR
jgi:pimeloyl-ACP methyl ester carboxylesterase